MFILNKIMYSPVKTHRHDNLPIAYNLYIVLHADIW